MVVQESGDCEGAAPHHDAPLIASAGRSSSGGSSSSTGAGRAPGSYPRPSIRPARASAAAGGDSDDDEDQQGEEGTWIDPLLFLGHLAPGAAPRRGAAAGAPLLPRRAPSCGRKTLVLDLDETLVHSTLDGGPGSEGADFAFSVPFDGGDRSVHVRVRPRAREFLERAAELFEVVVFTASQRVYADQVLDLLDPEGALIRHRIFREGCVVVGGNFLKDLSLLGRDLAHTAIVDNSPQAFGLQVDNGIPIESWYDDPRDTELPALLPLLSRLAAADDVRPVLRERFRLRERAAGAAAAWRGLLEREAAAAAVWRRQYELMLSAAAAAKATVP